MQKKKALILGAGITGLIAAWKLLSSTDEYEVTLIERNNAPGGLAKTIQWNGYNLDLGPHRFYTDIPEVSDFIKSHCDDIMAPVIRHSRMYLNGRYIQYPIKILETLRALGIGSSFRFFLSALGVLNPFAGGEAKNYEEYIQNKFGNELYLHIFKSFAEKVWGIDAQKISAETARVRISGNNIWHTMKDILFSKGETSLKEFLYPQNGIGSISDLFAEKIQSLGASIQLNQELIGIKVEDGLMRSAQIKGNEGIMEYSFDRIISTIPLPDLIRSISPAAPPEILSTASQLKFRSIVLLYLLFDKDLGLNDTWLYYPQKEIPFSRISIPDNFSPKPVREGRTCLCLEFPCAEGDEMWRHSVERIVQDAEGALIETGLISRRSVDAFTLRIRDGYPIYHTGYETDLQTVLSYMRSLKNCGAVGRQGLFHHNNIDLSIQMGLRIAESMTRSPTNFDSWYDELPQFKDYRIVD